MMGPNLAKARAVGRERGRVVGGSVEKARFEYRLNMSWAWVSPDGTYGGWIRMLTSGLYAAASSTRFPYTIRFIHVLTGEREVDYDPEEGT